MNWAAVAVTAPADCCPAWFDPSKGRCSTSQTSLQLFVDALSASNTDVGGLEELASMALAEAHRVGLLQQLSPLIQEGIDAFRAWDECFDPMSDPKRRRDAGKPSANALYLDRKRIASHLSRYVGVIQANASPASTAQDNESDYAPGEWFTLYTNIPTARLRQAASPKRKSKRVGIKMIDGRPWYCKKDASRWWPDDWIKSK